MVVSEADAQELVGEILQALKDLDCRDLLGAVEETRRAGVVEGVQSSEVLTRSKVGTSRRRPLSEGELLRLLIVMLHERLVVVPQLGLAVRSKLQTHMQPSTEPLDIVWSAEPSFLPGDAAVAYEFDVNDLLPQGWVELEDLVAQVGKALQINLEERNG